MNATQKPRIGLIAGSGQFPKLFIQGAREAGYEVVTVGFEGETEPELAALSDQFYWLKLGQLSKLVQTFKNAGVQRAAMTGAINKTRMYSKIRPDWRAFKLLRKLHNKKDDSLLRALAEELESDGIRIEPSTLFLPTLLAAAGTYTRRRLSHSESRDIEFGWHLAREIGRLDIGQCLVVKDQAVLAVEGIDGTDATIRRGGGLCHGGAIVLKLSKPSQDLRFDVPAVGLQTIDAMRAVKARVLVIEAGKTLLFDRERMIQEADLAGITIFARGDEPAAAGQAGAAAPAAPAVIAAPTTVSAQLSGPHPKPGAIRVAVIGVGYLGRLHAQKYAHLADADLVGVVDIDPERARRVAESVGTHWTTDCDRIMDQVQAVSVVTPTPSHCAVARRFLDRGIHVLLEKPMTVTLEEADELAALARSSGCVLQVGHLERFNPAFSRIFPEITRPMFIEAHRLAPFNERGLEVDVILDLMIHDIDIVLTAMGSMPAEIHASGVPVLTRLPDIANARLDFANGATANLTASRISLKSMRRMRIFQDNCYLVADFGKKRAFAFRKENEIDDTGYPEISAQELEVEQRDALEDELAAFLGAVRSGTEPRVSAADGRKALAVALEISRQIKDKIRLR